MIIIDAYLNVSTHGFHEGVLVSARSFVVHSCQYDTKNLLVSFQADLPDFITFLKLRNCN